jgi:3-deoxy-D-arabino-heptulosonate 7-phosphate (DAHP) synthase
LISNQVIKKINCQEENVTLALLKSFIDSRNAVFDDHKTFRLYEGVWDRCVSDDQNDEVLNHIAGDNSDFDEGYIKSIWQLDVPSESLHTSKL